MLPECMIKVSLQSQVLVPILIKLRNGYGNEQAMKIIRESIRGWYKDTYAKLSASIDGNVFVK